MNEDFNDEATNAHDTPPIRLRSDRPRALVRRDHPRYAVDVAIDLTSEHNFYGGLIENLSVGGVFVATHLERPVGTTVELAIRLPGAAAVRGVGEVRWIRRFSETSDAPPGLGIRFVILAPDAGQAIESFLAAREPILHDE